jgi:hypothetical protein
LAQAAPSVSRIRHIALIRAPHAKESW